jgi:hypothetical protein
MISTRTARLQRYHACNAIAPGPHLQAQGPESLGPELVAEGQSAIPTPISLATSETYIGER